MAWLGHLRKLELGRETAAALVRGLLQMLAIGLVLVWLLKGAAWWSFPALAAMCAMAATNGPEASEVGATLLLALPAGDWNGIGGGDCNHGADAGDRLQGDALVPLGSMIIANSMNTCSQVLERYASDLKLNAGRVEAALALGASSTAAALPYAKNATNAALIPSLNSLRSLGIVWIPGFAAGMLLTGSDPVYTAIYQFMVIAMIYAASGVTALVAAAGYERGAFEEERLVAAR